MSDHILIYGLRVEARVGVGEQERSRPQWLVANIDIAIDLAAAGESDDINDTVDYGVLTTEIADLLRGTETRLLEHLAEKVVALIAPNKAVVGVTVEIFKEAPPIAEQLGGVAVRLERAFI
nr:dihydroneopterin aldolase [Actinomycetota bacterium]